MYCVLLKIVFWFSADKPIELQAVLCEARYFRNIHIYLYFKNVYRTKFCVKELPIEPDKKKLLLKCVFLSSLLGLEELVLQKLGRYEIRLPFLKHSSGTLAFIYKQPFMKRVPSQNVPSRTLANCTRHKTSPHEPLLIVPATKRPLKNPC